MAEAHEASQRRNVYGLDPYQRSGCHWRRAVLSKVTMTPGLASSGSRRRRRSASRCHRLITQNVPLEACVHSKARVRRPLPLQVVRWKSDGAVEAGFGRRGREPVELSGHVYRQHAELNDALLASTFTPVFENRRKVSHLARSVDRKHWLTVLP